MSQYDVIEPVESVGNHSVQLSVQRKLAASSDRLYDIWAALPSNTNCIESLKAVSAETVFYCSWVRNSQEVFLSYN